MAEKEPGAIVCADLHGRARELLNTGVLPQEPALRVFAGYGDGATCLLCSSPIGPGEVEYEVEFGIADRRIVGFHLVYHEIWEYERQAVGENEGESEGAV